MLESTDQTNEQPAGVGIREQLKAQSARQDIERNHQRNLRIVQNQALLKTQLINRSRQKEEESAEEEEINRVNDTRSQELMDVADLENEAQGQNPEVERTPDGKKVAAVEMKKNINEILTGVAINIFIGIFISLISFGLLTAPYFILNFLFKQKRTIVRIRINHKRCYGKGVCMKKAPNTFIMGQSAKKALVIESWKDGDKKIWDASNECCKQAIFGYDLLGRRKTPWEEK